MFFDIKIYNILRGKEMNKFKKYHGSKVVTIIERNKILTMIKGILKIEKNKLMIGEEILNPQQIKKIQPWQMNSDVVFCEQILFGLKETKR